MKEQIKHLDPLLRVTFRTARSNAETISLLDIFIPESGVGRGRVHAATPGRSNVDTPRLSELTKVFTCVGSIWDESCLVLE